MKRILIAIGLVALAFAIGIPRQVAADSDGEIPVLIRAITGRPFSLEARLNDSINSLQEIIQEIEGFPTRPTSQQDLIDLQRLINEQSLQLDLLVNIVSKSQQNLDALLRAQ